MWVGAVRVFETIIPRGEILWGFYGIVPVLVIHPRVKSMVWVCAITVFKKWMPRGEGFVRVVCIVPHVNYTSHSGKHDVGGGNHGANLAERFLRGNKNNFCSSNHQFLCNVDAKNSFAHLDHWFYASNQPPSVMIQISNFGEDEIVSTFYACSLQFYALFPC